MGEKDARDGGSRAGGRSCLVEGNRFAGSGQRPRTHWHGLKAMGSTERPIFAGHGDRGSQTRPRQRRPLGVSSAIRYRHDDDEFFQASPARRPRPGAERDGILAHRHSKIDEWDIEDRAPVPSLGLFAVGGRPLLMFVDTSRDDSTIVYLPRLGYTFRVSLRRCACFVLKMCWPALHAGGPCESASNPDWVPRRVLTRGVIVDRPSGPLQPY